MPIGFDKCVAQGGTIKTKQLKGNKFQRICILGGKTFAGEIKKRKHPKRPPRTIKSK